MKTFLKSALIIVFVTLLATPNGCRREGNWISVTGYVEANEVDITPSISARIIEIRAEEGDPVERGDTLVVLDSREIEVSLKEAQYKLQAGKAKIDQLKAQLSLAKETLDDLKTLYEKGNVPEKEYRAQKTKVEVLDAGLKEAELTVKSLEEKISLLRLQLQKCFITSPLKGVVMERNQDPGELALPGIPLLTVANLDTLKLIAFLPETQMGSVSIGDTAYIHLDAFPNRTFLGTVSKINDRAVFVPKNVETKEERAKLVFEMEILLPNENNLLKPGMFADVRFRISR